MLAAAGLKQDDDDDDEVREIREGDGDDRDRRGNNKQRGLVKERELRARKEGSY